MRAKSSRRGRRNGISDNVGMDSGCGQREGQKLVGGSRWQAPLKRQREEDFWNKNLKGRIRSTSGRGEAHTAAAALPTLVGIPACQRPQVSR